MNLISVILPTYNRAAFLPGAIESVLGQTYQDIELIIIDDGSTDDTEAVVAPFLNDQRTRYIRQMNAGAAAARNHGLSLRQGKYVAFIDSDDTWVRDKLEIQFEIMKYLPDAGIVCSDFSSVDNDGCREKSHIRSYFSVLDDYNLRYEDVFQHVMQQPVQGFGTDEKVYWGNIYETMIFGNIILTSTCLCREEVFKNAGDFDTRYGTLEDYDLFLRISRRFPIAFIDKPLVCYRYSNDQLSGELHFEKLCANVIDIFKKNVEALKDEEFGRKNKNKIKSHLGMLHAQQAYFYFSHGNMSLAAQYYRQSILQRPGHYKSYLYLLFSLLPTQITSAVRSLKKRV